MKTGLSKPEKKLYKVIDEILWKEWDPIGVREFGKVARDEYSSYVPRVFSLVISNKSSKEISDYLFKIETENMGLSGKREKCDKIAVLVLRVRDK